MKCTQPGSACDATAVAQVSGISPGTENAVVSGLQDGTNYTCYVVAVNEEGSVCSAPKDIQTNSLPGQPTQVTTLGIGLTNWTVGTYGVCCMCNVWCGDGSPLRQGGGQPWMTTLMTVGCRLGGRGSRHPNRDVHSQVRGP